MPPRYEFDSTPRRIPAGGLGAAPLNPLWPRMAIVNRSARIPDSDLPDLLEAIQFQVIRHFGPWWGQGANLSVIRSDEPDPAPNIWPVWLLDNEEDTLWLGYHSTHPDGRPYAVVYRDLAGPYYSVTVSHEVLEMLGDPTITKMALSGGFGGSGKLFPWEACDACQGYAYWIVTSSGKSVAVSDFLTQLWYAPAYANNPHARFDYLGRLSRPFEVAPWGYSLVMDTGSSQWSTVWGRTFQTTPALMAEAAPPAHSRRARWLEKTG